MAILSVIIPVYNVEEFIDRCLASVTTQSYKDFDIILINDGSTDNSGKKCEEWATKDIRIKYIENQNIGLGATRNLGVTLAKTEYIIFLDSDDWWDKNLVKTVMDSINEQRSDLYYFDTYRVVCDENGKCLNKFTTCIPTTELCSTDIHHSPHYIYYLHEFMWNKVFRKDLFEEYCILQPNGTYEDIATMPLLLLHARSIVPIEKILYNYQINRVGSIVNNTNNVEKILERVKDVVSYYEKNNSFFEFKEQLRQFAIVCGQLQATRIKEKRPDLVINFKSYIATKFDWTFAKYVMLGSYNLYKGISKNVVDLSTELEDYQASSLISVMNNILIEKHAEKLTHNNPKRLFWIKNDWSKGFQNLLNENFEEKIYFIFDFLEERFPIGNVDDFLFTESDYYKEQNNSPIGSENIEKYSKEYIQLWKDACDKLAERLNNINKFCKIILVENYFCETYGSLHNQKMYSNIENIKEWNKILEDFYSYFLKKVENVVKISIPKEYQYTEENFQYGCYSYYQNNCAYEWIASQIRVIKED